MLSCEIDKSYDNYNTVISKNNLLIKAVEKVKKYQENYSNKTETGDEFKIGDMVWFKDGGKPTGKLNPIWPKTGIVYDTGFGFCKIRDDLGKIHIVNNRKIKKRIKELNGEECCDHVYNDIL